MKNHHYGITLALILAGFLIFGIFQGAIAQEYSLYNLGPSVIPYDINKSGVVTGLTQKRADKPYYAFVWTQREGKQNISPASSLYFPRINDKSLVAFSTNDDLLLWTQKTGILNLYDLGNGLVDLQDLNDRGEVVGASFLDENTEHAFIATAERGMQDLGTLGGTYSFAEAINKKGQVVGISTTAKGDRHAFIWTERDGMRDLGTLGGSLSWALDINDRGDVLGVSTVAVPPGELHAFIWNEREGMKDLGAPEAMPYISGAQITNSGHIVTAWSAAGIIRTFYFANGNWKDIGSFGNNGANFWAINDSGQVVGGSAISSGVVHAFLWEDGMMNDLNDFLPPGSEWVLVTATGINEAGQIIGSGGIGIVPHGFLMSPKPLDHK
jgi:probable HAF family extracellular repeat protein